MEKLLISSGAAQTGDRPQQAVQAVAEGLAIQSLPPRGLIKIEGAKISFVLFFGAHDWAAGQDGNNSASVAHRCS